MFKHEQERVTVIRLDKWLWAARFYKTRKIARDMINGGKIHYNQHRCKPNKSVDIGGVIRLIQGSDEKTVIVIQLSELRQSATHAQQLYQETVASLEKRQKIAEARKLNALTIPHPHRRPDKKERRNLIKLKQHD